MSPLLSGNGRHRRPRQAPDFLVAAGVTSAGLALPLLGASSASAADNATWDAVAECESGGLWSANDDNGYYGGLQLDQESWEEHGGTDYAARPDLAGRDQQITVGERILDAEGVGPFGDCAESAGLSEDDPGEPDVDPDGTENIVDGPVAERPYPTYPPGDIPEGGDFPEDEGSGGAPGSGESADPGDPAESPDSSPSTPDSPETSDPSAPEGSAGSGDGSTGDGGAGGSGSGDGGSGSGGSDAGRDGGSGEGGKGAEGGEHRVAAGESLYSIADEEQVPGGWRELYERNRELIGSDPDLILPGQELRL